MVDNTNRTSVLQALRSVLAATCACEEQDLVAEGVIITEATARPGRLRFPIASKPLIVVTMGAGVVVSCHAERQDWLGENLAQLRRDAIFSATAIGKLVQFVARDQQFLAGPDLKYVCSRSDFRPAAAPSHVEIALVPQADLPSLYQYQGFGEALSYRPNNLRPEVMATVARTGGNVVGIACASADTESLLQIGVEVSSGARGRGIGQSLVSQLTDGILRAGKIPYYTTAVSNLHSRGIAVSLGYRPAWTEMYAKDS